MLKLFKPYVSPGAAREVSKVLYSGKIAEGPVVKEFEELFSEMFNVKNVVAVNSGTSALELAYDLADIKEGDEVITPVLTCTATNIPLLRRKAKIVWADINDSLNMDPADVARKISGATKAVVFVHFGGNNQGIEEINALCKKHKVQLIEDAAQALGSGRWGIGNHTAVSFQAIKQLTTGDGGMYIGDRSQKARRLRWFGYDREKKQELGDTDLLEAGYKFHMNDIAAAIGKANLQDWNLIMNHLNVLRSIYTEAGLFAHAWLAGGFTDNYEGLKAHAADEGFEVGQHHYRNDKYTVFGGRRSLPSMDRLENKYFFVPFHMGVTYEDAQCIVDTCRPWMR